VKPAGTGSNNNFQLPLQPPQSRKERLVLERDLQIHRDNRIMLRKLIEIDMNMKSDLNKKNLQPVAFKVRKPSKGMPSMRP
jgi:hypothetical protein